MLVDDSSVKQVLTVVKIALTESCGPVNILTIGKNSLFLNFYQTIMKEIKKMLNAESEQMERISAEAIKELIKAEGIDLVGIADAESDFIVSSPPCY